MALSYCDVQNTFPPAGIASLHLSEPHLQALVYS